MKRELHEIWKEMEGSRPVWKIQCPKGRLTFRCKKDAEKFKQGIIKIGNTEKVK